LQLIVENFEEKEEGRLKKVILIQNSCNAAMLPPKKLVGSLGLLESPQKYVAFLNWAEFPSGV